MYGILRLGVVSTPEIAQFQLGDLAINVHTLLCPDLFLTHMMRFVLKRLAETLSSFSQVMGYSGT